MPSKRKSAGKGAASEPEVATSEPEVATRRSTRGASASNAGTKRKASPSPAPRRAASAKKGRTRSPSPSPAPSSGSRASSRGRSDTTKKEETKVAATSRGRVTRNAVQDEEAQKSTPRSSSRALKATPATPKQAATPKGKTATPKQKSETPKQSSTTPRSKSATPKQAASTPKKAASTPKQKPSPKQKTVTPKQATKKEPKPQPAKKSAPKASQKKKTETETSPKKATRPTRRSRGDVEATPTEDEKLEEKDEAMPEENEEEVTAETEAPVEKKQKSATEVETDDTMIAEKPEDGKEVEKDEDNVDRSLKDEDVTSEIPADNKGEEVSADIPTDDGDANEDLAKEEEQVDSKADDEQTEDKEDTMDTELNSADTEVSEEQGVEQTASAENKQVPVVDDTNKQSENEDTGEVDQPEKAAEEDVENVEMLNEDSIEPNEQLNETTDNTASDHELKPSEDLVDLNEDSAEPATNDETAVVNDVDNESSGIGSGEPDMVKKNTEVEEISDDDIEEIKTVEPVVLNVGSNGDIECVEDQVNENASSDIPVSPSKRKIDEVDRDVKDEGSPLKKARISTEEDIQSNGGSSQDDIAKDYVVIDMEDVPQAESLEVKQSLPNPIFNRVFIPNPGFSGTIETSRQFSVVSYNMLADCHLNRNDYSFTDNEFLKSEYRLKKVLEELTYLDADVICMQEVDPDYFVQQLLPGLRRLGYEGVHKQRLQGDYYYEGEATFYRTSRFSLIEASSAPFSQLVEKEFVEGIDPSIQQAVRDYMNLPDVLIVTKLKCNNTGLEITVGNVHIQWGEMKVPDAQCVQIASAVKEIVSRASGDNFPHIICGDFNSPPMSPGYLVARDGYPSGDETINKLMQIQGLQLPDGKTAALVNSLWPAFQHTSSSLRSAYSEAQGYEPEITSFNRVMCECVDYIFYSSMSLENVGVLQTASKERIMETGGIPDHFFPSDHVSIKAVLAFK